MKRSTQIVLIASVGLGLFLRLFLLRDQIPLNDDWHGLMYAATHSLLELFSSSSSFAHSSPLLNIYRWLLLHTIGWSELFLCLPSVLAGICALLIFPHLVRRAHGDRIALIFSMMLALSPLLVFYSRVGRPYGPLVFFLFLSIYSGGFWVRCGRGKYLAVYLGSAVLAMYLHPVAVVSVFSPLLAGAGCSLFRDKSVQVSLLWMGLVGGLLGLITFVILRPAMTMTGSVMANNPLPDFEAWRQALLMFFGTSGAPLAFGMLGLAACGAIRLFRQSLFWGGLLLGLFALNLFAIWVGRFSYAHAAIVLARYLLILCPVLLLWVAVALNGLWSVSRAGGVAACAGLFVLLAVTSPLWRTFDAPNNFTNHSAFQESYEVVPRNRPRSSKMFPWIGDQARTSLPEFYQKLPANTVCLIEYPMMLGDHFNLFYFYQALHKKRVVAGYSREILREQGRTDGVYGDYLINHVLRKIETPEKIRFRNIVNIYDEQAVQKTGADYLIVHINLIDEMYGDAVDSRTGTTPALKSCVMKMMKRYGKPIYADPLMLIFSLEQT